MKKIRRYSIEHKCWIFVKGYWYLSFAKNMTKNIDKDINKKLSGNYSQKILDHTKESAADALKTASMKNDSKNSRNNCWFNW